MKILYLLFTFLFLAFLTEPGNAHHLCARQGGRCIRRRCPPRHRCLGQVDCRYGWKCCVRRYGK